MHRRRPARAPATDPASRRRSVSLVLGLAAALGVGLLPETESEGRAVAPSPASALAEEASAARPVLRSSRSRAATGRSSAAAAARLDGSESVAAASAWTLVGQVTDSEGRAIEGALVTALAADPGLPPGVAAAKRPLEETRTDDQGRYELRCSVPASCVAVRAQALGYVGATLEALSVPGRYDIALREGAGAIEGVVVDPEGRPLAGVAVEHLTDFSSDTALSGRDGRFRFPDVGLGPHVLVVRSWSHFPVRREVLVDEASTVEVRLELEPTPSLAGVVVDASTGAPVAGARVTDAWLSTVVDAEGRFEFPASRGATLVRVDARGYASVARRLEDTGTTVVELRAGIAYAALLEAEGQLPGDLRCVFRQDAGGMRHEALADVRAVAPGTWLAVATGLSEVEDTPELGAPPEGMVGVAASSASCVPAEGIAARWTDGKAWDTLPRVPLVPAAVLDGRVRGPAGEGVAGCVVICEALDGSRSPRGVSAPERVLADSEGRFRLRSLAAGRYALRADVAGQPGCGAETEVVLVPGREHEVVLAHEPLPVVLGSIEGTVYSSGERPLSRAVVELTDRRGRRWTTRSGADGHFQFDELPRTDYEVRSFRRDGDRVVRWWSSGLVVAPDGAPVEIAFSR